MVLFFVVHRSSFRGRPGRRTPPRPCWHPLLAVVILDRLVDLLLPRLRVDRRRVLHRRVVDGRPGQLPPLLLDEDEPPELAGVEVVAVAERAGQRGFPGDAREALEGV